jgi:hypothetical protein
MGKSNIREIKKRELYESEIGNVEGNGYPH